MGYRSDLIITHAFTSEEQMKEVLASFCVDKRFAEYDIVNVMHVGKECTSDNKWTFFVMFKIESWKWYEDSIIDLANGSQLKKFAKPLVDLGIKRINISLDTLNPEKFKKITRWGRLEQVLEGIQEAKKSGLSIKINKVALKKTNQDELNDFVKWCGDEGFDLTFIEVMPMGDFGADDRLDQYWSLQDLRKDLEKIWTLNDISLTTGGPARYCEILETGQKVGFITPLTHNFCESCNRVRMTCTGQFFMFLGQEEDADLRSALRENINDDTLLRKRIMQAIDRKPKGHDFDYSRQKISGQMSRYMSHTGG